MAFTSVVTDNIVIGNRRLSFGTFTNGAEDVGGDIATGMKTCLFFTIVNTSHVGGDAVKVTRNNSANGTVTIVTGSAVDGEWLAIGL